MTDDSIFRFELVDRGLREKSRASRLASKVAKDKVTECANPVSYTL